MYVLNRSDADNDWCFERCREVAAEPDGILDLWAREHYKSTIITFALTIQDILATHGDEAMRGPEVTVGIFSHTRPIAKAFLRQIMQELEGNLQLKLLFPDVLYADPRKQSPKWSEDEGIRVKRSSNPKEETIEAWGLVDGMPTSKHYHLRVYDDVVTEKSVTTPEMIKKTTDQWALSLNLGAQGGVSRYCGTIYHEFDSYRVMRERGMKCRLYPATEGGVDDVKLAVFRTPTELEEKRKLMGIEVYATQMLLNPKLAHVATFDEEDLRWWDGTDFANLNIIILVDPASAKKKDSDYTAIWVVGFGADDNRYAIEHIRDRLGLKERVYWVMALHKKFKPVFVGYEKYGLQSDIEAIQWEQERQNYRFDITELAGKTKKEDRIKRLQPIIKNNRLYLPAGGCVHINYDKTAVDTIKTFIREELVPFPVCAHDDSMDSLSRMEDAEVKMFVSLPIGDADKMPDEYMQRLLREEYDKQQADDGLSWQGR